MLFAVDIGNTSISCGVFCIESGELLCKFKLASDISRTSDEYVAVISSMLAMKGIEHDRFRGGIICSVVPMLTHTVAECVQMITKSRPKIIGQGLKSGFSIRIDNPSELGADLVANTAAVLDIMKDDVQNAVIIDMGTATTISALTDKKEYIGNCILPGVKVELDSLHMETAQLPSVAVLEIKKAIGKNSSDSVRSGIILGNAIAISGLIDRFEKEMKIKAGSARIFATGGLSSVVLPHIDRHIYYDDSLTLRGSYVIYKNNER